MATLKIRNPKNPWEHNHNVGVHSNFTPFTSALVEMLGGWQRYAEDHRARYHGSLGDTDAVLGPEWEQIGLGLRGLLNGELGVLDGGTLDSFICETLTENGFEVE